MRKIAFATAFAFGALFAGAAQGEQIRQFKVANWEVGVYTFDDSGKFSHCAAAVRYKSGITLLFSVTQTLEWAIGFSSPDWNLRPNREIDVEYRIDGGAMNTVTGRSVNNRLVRAALPDSVALFNQFRFGLRLVASVDGGKSVLYNLTDTSAMLAALLDCAKEYKNYVHQKSPRRGPETDRETGPSRGPATNEREDPPRSRPNESDRETDVRPRNNNQFSTGTGSGGNTRNARMPDRDDEQPRPQRNPTQTAPSPATGPSPESRAEAQRIASDILRRANITEFKFQTPEDLRGNFTAHDVVWNADGVTGTLRILAGDRATTLEKIRAEVIASDVGSCNGKFASGALPAMSGSTSISIFTSCEGEKNWSTYYIAVPRRDGGSYLLSVVGAGEAANRLQSVTNVYRTAALEVLEK